MRPPILSRSAHRVLSWTPLALCVGGAIAAFLLLDPSMRPGDPAMIPIDGRAAALREAQGWYGLAIAGCAVSLLWAMSWRLFAPPSRDPAAP